MADSRKLDEFDRLPTVIDDEATRAETTDLRDDPGAGNQVWRQAITADTLPHDTIRPEPGASQQLTGRIDGDIQMGEVIGRGGLGEVRQAIQHAFQREVAVKTLRKNAKRARPIHLFLAEAVVTAYLEHPNIIPVHELRQDADGRLQLVMKKVQGRTWHEILHPRDGEAPHSLDEHIEILLKVCDAMAFAHDRGIIHRDLKPENVMVGSFGEVLVMDWGCAIATPESAVDQLVPRLHRGREVAGTPMYMPPEMVAGDLQRIGTWSDVFQLGAILYEILTGKPPYTGKSASAVMELAERGEILPPQQRRPEREIPLELAELCMRALQAEHYKRIQQVPDFIAWLEDWRKHSQAVDLVAVAQREINHAGDSRKRHGGEHWRRALVLSEQALELWNGCPQGRAALVTAGLGYAQHLLRAGAAMEAIRHTKEVAARARAWHFHEEVAELDRVLAAAERLYLQRRHRRRQFATIRWGLLGVATLSLAALGFVIWRLADDFLVGQRLQAGIELTEHLAEFIHSQVEMQQLQHTHERLAGLDFQQINLVNLRKELSAIVSSDASGMHRDPERLRQAVAASLDRAEDWGDGEKWSDLLAVHLDGGPFSGPLWGIEQTERGTRWADVSEITVPAFGTIRLPPDVEVYRVEIASDTQVVQAYRIRIQTPALESALLLDISAENVLAARQRLALLITLSVLGAVCLIGATSLLLKPKFADGEQNG